MFTIHGASEFFSGFESQSDVAVSKKHAMCKSAKIPSELLAFLLLSNARLDGGQRVSILAFVSSNLKMSRVSYSRLHLASTVFTKGSIITLPWEAINHLDYDKVASVMRISDQGRNISKMTKNCVFPSR